MPMLEPGDSADVPMTLTHEVKAGATDQIDITLLISRFTHLNGLYRISPTIVTTEGIERIDAFEVPVRFDEWNKSSTNRPANINKN